MELTACCGLGKVELPESCLAISSVKIIIRQRQLGHARASRESEGL